MSSYGFLPLVGLLMVAFCIVLGVLVVVYLRARNPSIQFQAAEEALARGNAPQAEKRYERVVSLLEARHGRRTAQENALLPRACLALGRLRAATDSAGACESYGKARALGAHLPRDAVVLMAQHYASAGSTSAEAVELYLAFLRAAAKKRGADQTRVCDALQRACAVSETAKAAERKAAAALNRQVAEIAPDLDWPHYHLGLALFLEGRYSEAADELSRSIGLNPGAVSVLYWLALCRLNQDAPDLEGAIALLDRFLACPDSDARPMSRKAHLAFEVGRRLGEVAPARGVPYLEGAVERQPGNPDYLYELGRAHRRTGALARGADAFCRALAAKADHLPARGALAETCVDLGDLPMAETELRAYLERSAGDTRYRCLLVRVLYDQGRPGDVVKEVEGKVGLRPTSPEAAEAAFVIARAYAGLGRFQPAVQWYGVVLARSAVHSYYLGCAYANLRQWDAALGPLGDAVQQGGDFKVKALVQRGHVAFMSGRWQVADQDYQEALRLDAENSGALYGSGLLRYREDQLDVAAGLFRRALETAPGDAATTLALGACAERGGDLPRARSLYRELCGHSAYGATARLRLAVVSCREGDYDLAFDLIGDRVDSEPADETVLSCLAAATYGKGRPDEAIRIWEILARMYPEDERLAVNIARAHYAQAAKDAAGGRYREAVEGLETYLARYPQDDKVKAEMAELRFRLFASALREARGRPTEEGARHLEMALALDPTHPTYRFYRALQSLHNGDLEAAEQLLRNLLEESPESQRLEYHLAQCLLARESAEGLSRLSQLGAQPGEGYPRYARYTLRNELVRQGKYEEVVRLAAQDAL